MSATDIHTRLTAERVREVLDYNQETGELRWRISKKGIVAGKAPGYENSAGYRVVCIEGRRYRAHRLAWLYMQGEWPVNEIDHINGVRNDNRAANLRDVSGHVNQQNRRQAQRPAVPSPFNTGLLGTHFDRERQVFVAQIQNPVTRKQKNLGRYATAAEAHQAYLEAKRRLHKGCTL